MKKKKINAIVCEPKELNPSPKVTNCCKSLCVKYSFQKERMTRLASNQPLSAMSRNPDHNSPSQPKENSLGQNHHQEETIHQLAMQLKNIGDSVDHWMAQENLQREGREALAPFVVVFHAVGRTLLLFLWNYHWM